VLGPFAHRAVRLPRVHRRRTGFIERLKLDSYQGRGVLTFLVNGAGHHVIRAAWMARSATTNTRRPIRAEPPWQYLQGNSAPDGLPAMNEARTLRIPHRARHRGDARQHHRRRASRHRRLLHPGQLEHHGQGHPERRAPLRHAGPLRRGRHHPDGAEGPALASHRRGLGSDTAGPLEDLRRTTAGTTRTSLSTSPTASSASSRRSSATRTPTATRCGIGGLARCDAAKRLTSGLAPESQVAAGLGGPGPVDPDLKSAANDEVVAGAEYEVSRTHGWA
jgi:hypothetical protein